MHLPKTWILCDPLSFDAFKLIFLVNSLSGEKSSVCEIVSGDLHKLKMATWKTNVNQILVTSPVIIISLIRWAGRYEEKGFWSWCVSGWVARVKLTAPQSAQDIWPTFAPTDSLPLSLFPLSESTLRLIKLDQDDTNNWLKLGAARRPNDPYLTPFVAMVSLFPLHAPFGTVYLGSVTSVSAQSPAEHNSSLTSWEQRKGYIFSRCLLINPFIPFFQYPQGRQKERESRLGVLVWNVPGWYQ